MFCPKCGAPVNPGARFCNRCGASLSTPESSQSYPDALLVRKTAEVSVGRCWDFLSPSSD